LNAQHTRVAIGAPVFNRADYLEEAIESLLLQSYPDFALVVMDDCSSDATPDIVKRYAKQDPRVHYHRNAERVGMVENWRRAFRLASEKVPGLEYFAFGSDHDVWHPLWLESMVRELDADPAVVVAFPLWAAISTDGKRLPLGPRQRWDTANLPDPVERTRRLAPGRKTPNVIYGLFRAWALERCDVYAFVLAPDRLLMNQLAVLGTFKQVPRELWLRRLWGQPQAHQRRRLFVGRPPLHTYLPTGLVHAAKLFRWLVVEGRAQPQVGRLLGIRIFGVYLSRVFLYPSLRRRTRMREWAQRQQRKWRKRQHRWVKRHPGLRTTVTWVRSTRTGFRRIRRRALRRAKGALRSLAAPVVNRQR
jgi:glycosyltransferase involved in cell wall biosynthesis